MTILAVYAAITLALFGTNTTTVDQFTLRRHHFTARSAGGRTTATLTLKDDMIAVVMTIGSCIKKIKTRIRHKSRLQKNTLK